MVQEAENQRSCAHVQSTDNPSNEFNLTTAGIWSQPHLRTRAARVHARAHADMIGSSLILHMWS
jgi:hypothetical protein